MSSRISCPQCDKTFRTETGLRWHLEHIHEQHQPKLSPAKAVLKETVKEALKEVTGRAYQRGYEQSKKDWQIWYFCDVCGERIDISPFCSIGNRKAG